MLFRRNDMAGKLPGWVVVLLTCAGYYVLVLIFDPVFTSGTIIYGIAVYGLIDTIHRKIKELTEKVKGRGP